MLIPVFKDPVAYVHDIYAQPIWHIMPKYESVAYTLERLRQAGVWFATMPAACMPKQIFDGEYTVENEDYLSFPGCEAWRVLAKLGVFDIEPTDENRHAALERIDDYMPYTAIVCHLDPGLMVDLVTESDNGSAIEKWMESNADDAPYKDELYDADAYYYYEKACPYLRMTGAYHYDFAAHNDHVLRYPERSELDPEITKVSPFANDYTPRYELRH